MTCSLDEWLESNLDERSRVVGDIIQQLGSAFEPDLTSLSDLSPVVIHKGCAVRFRIIFPHEFKFGFDAIDEQIAAKISSPIQANLDEMRPACAVRLNCFAISEEPIRASLASTLLHVPPSEAGSHPAYLSRTEAERCAELLGGSLPTERQWEGASRGKCSGIFPFGNDLPPESELERWMTFNLDDPNLGRNGFGLSGIFFGEWCKERYSTSHDSQAPVLTDSYVIKGGGAFFWPWQDDEWIWCLVGMRMPSSDLVDGTAATRVVLNDLK